MSRLDAARDAVDHRGSVRATAGSPVPFALRRDSLITVAGSELDDLRTRITSTRWPLPWRTAPWAAGTDGNELRRLAGYWTEGYDWPAHEAEINALPSFIAEVSGQRVHFLRFGGGRRVLRVGELPPLERERGGQRGRSLEHGASPKASLLLH